MNKIRTVRNFWLDLEVDGRTSHVGTGPLPAKGGFSLCIRVRDRGEVGGAVRIVGQCTSEGALVIMAEGLDGKQVMLGRSVR